jgi:PLAT/LH2 domain
MRIPACAAVRSLACSWWNRPGAVIPVIIRGDLTQIYIGHDNAGPNPGWYLDSVRIYNQTKGGRWRFYYNGWLAVDEPDAGFSTSTILAAIRVNDRSGYHTNGN